MANCETHEEKYDHFISPEWHLFQESSRQFTFMSYQINNEEFTFHDGAYAMHVCYEDFHNISSPPK